MSAVFDAVAESYDESFSATAIGRAQRDVVWRRLRLLVKAGDRVLDLGCGTGVDASFLASLGASVRGLDASAGMITRARARVIDAVSRPTFEVRHIEDLAGVEGSFDLVLSNFSPLDMVEDLRPVGAELARLIRPGGRLLLTTFGRRCLWEPPWRRRETRPGPRVGSEPVVVHYRGAIELAAELGPVFALERTRGVGLLVPPSRFRAMPAMLVRGLATLERPFLGPGAWLADHLLTEWIRR